jgi:hypothetical protein
MKQAQLCTFYTDFPFCQENGFLGHFRRMNLYLVRVKGPLCRHIQWTNSVLRVRGDACSVRTGVRGVRRCFRAAAASGGLWILSLELSATAARSRGIHNFSSKPLSSAFRPSAPVRTSPEFKTLTIVEGGGTDSTPLGSVGECRGAQAIHSTLVQREGHGGGKSAGRCYHSNCAGGGAIRNGSAD